MHKYNVSVEQKLSTESWKTTFPQTSEETFEDISQVISFGVKSRREVSSWQFITCLCC